MTQKPLTAGPNRETSNAVYNSREMRLHPVFLCVALALAPAVYGALPDFQAPGGGDVKLGIDEGNRITVASDYWRIEFDLRNGGVLDSVVFPHGTGRNVLTEPMVSYVDGWRDAYAPGVEVKTSNNGNVLRIVFSGRMSAPGRQAGPVAFRTEWVLSPFVARASHTLEFSEDMTASRVGIGSFAVRRDLDEFGLRAGPGDDPDRRKMAPGVFGRIAAPGGEFIAEHHAPLYLLFFHRQAEGFDVTTASDLETWESGLTGRPGVGRYSASVTANSVRVLREPVSAVRPLRIRKGSYTFDYYLGLPRIVEKSDRKWRHLSFGNHPWPSDAEIARWAENGVNIARLHNDYSADENFWHDGAWPPYDEKGMAEMKRVIATCHKHKIQVVPYFSLHEFHPKAEGYAANENAWKRSMDQVGTVYHNLYGKGEFGAQMCPQSGWSERRKRDIEKAYRELGFDGLYYDWVMQLACNNKAHDAKLHDGADGVVDLLAWSRRLIGPKGTLILHLYGSMPTLAFENFADLVVNMEEISSAEKWMKMGDAPVVTVLGESIPRSPCPSYREDNARDRNRNNISQLVLLGMFPWSGGTGGDVYEETLKLFRAFKPYRLEDYKFRDAFSGAVHTGWEDVYGALYAKSGGALAVVSNTSREPRKNVVWRILPEALGFKAARVFLREGSGAPRVVDTRALSDGSMTVDLGAWEYRVYEVTPQ
jgi:hypothetical protein